MVALFKELGNNVASDEAGRARHSNARHPDVRLVF
jgi:hypothetical protein